MTPDATEEQIAAIHEQVEQTTKKMGGSLVKTDNWGRRKLAYAIQHHKEGVYVLEMIEGGGELMRELDRRLKVVDQVIRQLIVRVDEEQRVVERTRHSAPDVPGAPARRARAAAASGSVGAAADQRR